MKKRKEVIEFRDFVYCDKCGSEIGEVDGVSESDSIVVFKSLYIGPGGSPHQTVVACDGCRKELAKMFSLNEQVQGMLLKLNLRGG